VTLVGGAAGVARRAGLGATSGALSRAGGRGVLVPSLVPVTSTPGSSTASCAATEAQLKTAMHASSAGRREYRPMTRVLRQRCRAAPRAPGERARREGRLNTLVRTQRPTG